jgi:hypothetical protein
MLTYIHIYTQTNFHKLVKIPHDVCNLFGNERWNALSKRSSPSEHSENGRYSYALEVAKLVLANFVSTNELPRQLTQILLVKNIGMTVQQCQMIKSDRRRCQTIESETRASRKNILSKLYTSIKNITKHFSRVCFSVAR